MSRSIPWLILLLSVFLISYFSSVLDLKNESRSIIVFLGILPLLNVVFDWFSLGVTRFLLRKTNNDNAYYRPYLNGFIDAIAAIIILILLAICITSTLQFMNILAYAGGASQPMIDLPGVIKTMRERPGDPAVWWVYIMLFSTLLPSFAHAVIASGHVVTWGLPRSLLERHRKAFKEGFEGDYVKLLKTARTMTLRRVAEFGVAIFGIGIMVFLLWTLHLGLPQLAALLLDISEAIASWQGAILS